MDRWLAISVLLVASALFLAGCTAEGGSPQYGSGSKIAAYKSGASVNATGTAPSIPGAPTPGAPDTQQVPGRAPAGIQPTAPGYQAPNPSAGSGTPSTGSSASGSATGSQGSSTGNEPESSASRAPPGVSLPDLVVKDISFSPACPAVGDNTAVTITLANEGNNVAGPTTLTVKTPDCMQAVQRAYPFEVGNMYSGDVKQYTFRVWACAPTGDSNDFTATADSGNAGKGWETELDEANNVLAKAMPICSGTGSNNSLADLRATLFMDKNPIAYGAESGMLSMYIRNVGNSPAPPSLATLTVETKVVDKNRPNSYTWMVRSTPQRWQLTEMGVGGETGYPQQWLCPAAPATFRLTLNADVNSQVNEITEENNAASILVDCTGQTRIANGTGGDFIGGGTDTTGTGTGGSTGTSTAACSAAGYAQITPLRGISTNGYTFKLDSVSGTTAYIGIWDSSGSSLGEVAVSAGQSITYSAPDGAQILVSICSVTPGSSATMSAMARIYSTTGGSGTGGTTGSSNQSGGATTAAKPNLIVSSITFDKACLNQGDSATVSIKVKNTGTATASQPVKLKVEPNICMQAATYDQYQLGPGQEDTRTFTYTLCMKAITEFKATVDPANLNAESNEADNVKAVSLSPCGIATQGGSSSADLAITSLTFSPATPAVGATVTGTVKIMNKGTSSSNYATGKVTNPACSALNNFDPVRQFEITPIQPGQTFTYTYQFFACQPVDDNYVTVEADISNWNNDPDRSNNVMTKQLPVTGASSGGSMLPDLKVMAFSADRTTLYTGDTATFTRSIKNIGNTAAPASMATVVVTRSGMQAGATQYWQLTQMPPYAQSGDSGGTYFMCGASKGTYVYTLTADANGVVEEANEENNALSVTLTCS